MLSFDRHFIVLALLLHYVSSEEPLRGLQWRKTDDVPWYLDSSFVVGSKAASNGEDIYLINEDSKYKYNTDSEKYTEISSDRNWDYDRDVLSQAYTQIGNTLYFTDNKVFDLTTQTMLSELPLSTSRDYSFACLASNTLEVPPSVSSQDTTFYGSQSTIDIDLLTGLNASESTLNTYSFIYGTGGASSTWLSSEFYIWNIGTNKVIQGPALPNARQYHSCNVVNNTLYVIGGNLDNNVKTDSILYVDISDMSDIDNWEWNTFPVQLSVARAGLRSIVFKHWLYVIGGYSSDSNNGLSTVDIIDTIDGTISEGYPLPVGVAFAGAINADDRLYVFGGADIHIIEDDTSGGRDGIGADYLQYALLPIEIPDRNSFMDSSTVSILYFVLNLLLVIIISIGVYLNGEHRNMKDLLKRIWSRKGIYAEVIAHLFDTATDIGVLVDWYLLAYDGFEYDVNMMTLFWTSISFQIFYRTMLCCYAYATPGGVTRAEEPTFCVDAPLACTDCYILKTVYFSLKSGDSETNPRQSAVQLIEALLEAGPQIVLQCIYLSGGFFDPILQENGDAGLVVLSLIVSVYSIASKFTTLDKGCVIEEARELGFAKKWPCINPLYVLRVLWRSSYVIARMFLMALIWTVLSGNAFVIYFSTMSVIWYIFLCIASGNDTEYSLTYYLCCTVCTGHPITRDTNANVCHYLEMIVFMIFLSVVYSSQDGCDSLGEFLCASTQSYSDGNSVMQLFFITAWIALVVDFVLFVVMYKTVYLENVTLGDTFKVFIEGQEMDPTVKYGKTADNKTANEDATKEGKA